MLMNVFLIDCTVLFFTKLQLNILLSICYLFLVLLSKCSLGLRRQDKQGPADPAGPDEQAFGRGQPPAQRPRRGQQKGRGRERGHPQAARGRGRHEFYFFLLFCIRNWDSAAVFKLRISVGSAILVIAFAA